MLNSHFITNIGGCFTFEMDAQIPYDENMKIIFFRRLYTTIAVRLMQRYEETQNNMSFNVTNWPDMSFFFAKFCRQRFFFIRINWAYARDNSFDIGNCSVCLRTCILLAYFVGGTTEIQYTQQILIVFNKDLARI